MGTIDQPARPRRRKKPTVAQTMGGVLFGFEQQVWRTAPPPEELVHHARPDAPVPAGDGTFLTIELPPLLAGSRLPEDEARLAPEPAVAVDDADDEMTAEAGAPADDADSEPADPSRSTSFQPDLVS